ncbi:hypothetical protein WA158_007128 [Blastocystis sp. Blastoise]
MCTPKSNYQLLNYVGDGTYGAVYKAKKRETGEIVALKRVKLLKEEDIGFPITSIREFRLLKLCKHPNIVNLEDIIVGDNRDEVYMVLEYCDHDIYELLESTKKGFTISEVKCLIKQLLDALQYMQSNWIIHRDIKTSNLLYTNRGQLKLADFGMARTVGNPPRKLSSSVVTLWYRSPELLLGQNDYSFPVDIWSVGCIMGELIRREPILPGKNEKEQLLKIFSLLGYPSETECPSLYRSPLYTQTVEYQTICKHSQLATTFPELSPSGIDLLTQLLAYEPSKRITAEQALQHEWFKELPFPQDPIYMPTFPPRKLTPYTQKVGNTNFNSLNMGYAKLKK